MSINYTAAPVRSQEDRTIRGDLQTSTYSKGKPDVGAFQRMLLKANGTVTDLLEAYLSEPIEIVKLSETLERMQLELPNLKLNTEEHVIARKVLLQGKISRRNFIYAHSFILLDNLEERFSRELLNTKKPIGKLWSQEKVETFKEVVDSGKEPANGLSNYFCIEPDENLLFRTYSVSSRGKITMIITEKFPESYFTPQFPLGS